MRIACRAYVFTMSPTLTSPTASAPPSAPAAAAAYSGAIARSTSSRNFELTVNSCCALLQSRTTSAPRARTSMSLSLCTRTRVRN